MNLRHGHLWQRLGLTIVLGIVATSYAPAALAAPVDEQGAQSDSSIADSHVSRSEEEAQSGSAAVDQTSARDADTAEAATASSEEKAEEGGSAQVLTFPGTSGPTRIHILSTAGAADAILLESRGVFAMIDGGEGVGAPDGSDPRYPWRDGIEGAAKGDTDWVLGYLRRNGVTSSNLAFYMGTHAHSDHIDNADDIIYAFHPQAILTPEYSDAWITDKSRLWDNQWCYDNMMTAARWAASAYGATIIQHVNDDDTHIQLGDMDVQLIPVDPDENYKKVGVRDANLIAYTAKVNAFGHSAYLAADLEARGGYEDRIAPIVGHVDLLKAGHHGMASSNFPPFMETLSPSMIVQTGPKWFTPDSLTDSVIHGDTSWAPTLDLWSAGSIPAIVATLTSSGISYNDLSAASWGHEYGGVTPRAWWFKGARPSATTGWWQGRSGYWYYFAGKPSAEASTWVYDGGQWYWMDATGAMATGWIHDGKSWYYLDSAGHPAGNGWSLIGSSWYYLSGGRVATGWLYDAGSWYYLNAATGAMATGWVQVDGQWYFLRSSGAMVTGWMNGGGPWYYLTGSGAMATGWLYDNGSWYYLDATNGAMATGWFQDGTTWYYSSSSGAMATGWILDHGAWYYMDEAGAMVTGTQEIDGRSSTFSLSGRWVGYAS